MVAKVGFSMLNPEPEPEAELVAGKQSKGQAISDIAFTPIAMPLLSGPGSIAVTISMATQVSETPDYLGVAIGILLVVLVSWFVLRSSTRIIASLGKTGVNVLTRLMGLILVCIGIQFLVTGLFELVTDATVVRVLTELYAS